MKRIALVLGLVVSLVFVSNAQYVSKLGRFKVDQVRGCAPFTMKVLDTNLLTPGDNYCNSPSLTCNFAPDQSQPTLQLPFNSLPYTYVFTTAGTYTVSIIYPNIGADEIDVIVDPDTKPPFDVYTCANDNVYINITDKTYDSYKINFGDGSAIVPIPSGNTQTLQHAYTVPPNSYNISVQGIMINSANNCSATVHPFTPLTTLPTPTINTLTAVDASNIKIDYTPQTNIEYHLEIGVNNGTNFQQYQTLYGVSTTTSSNLKVDDNYYCYRLSSYDPCNNANTYSLFPVCSDKFSVTAASGLNQLTWSTYTPDIASTYLNRDGKLYETFPGSPLYEEDKTITCGTKYCYTIINHYSNGSTTSISLQKCAVAFTTDTPTSISDISSVVAGNEVKLSWLQDPAFKTSAYDVTRSQNGSLFATKGTSKTTQYTDSTFTSDGGYCYKVNYSDLCNNKSADGSPACPILLTGTLDKNNTINLSWPAYNGWAQGVASYTIEKYNKNGALIQTIDAGSSLTYVDDQTDLKNQIVYYKIIANPVNPSSVASVSNEIEIIKEANLFFPNAFTPNRDKLNDSFNVSGHYIAEMELKIFDRWGSLIFYSDKNEAWDGTQNGVAMPEAAYVWTADVTDISGRHFKRTGTILLLQKSK